MIEELYDENEISLKDYLRIINKRKKIIFFTFFIFFIVAIIGYFQALKFTEYRFLMEIAPGYAFIADKEVLDMYGYEDIKKLLSNDNFIFKIEKANNLYPGYLKGKFIISRINNSDTARIEMPWEKDNGIMGLAIMNNLFKLLSNDLNNRIIIEKEKIEFKVKHLPELITMKLKVTKSLNELIEKINKSIEDLYSELEATKQKFSESSKKYAKKKNNNDAIKWIEKLNGINKEIVNFIRERERAEGKVIEVSRELKALQLLSEELTANKNSFHEILLKQQPRLLKVSGKTNIFGKFISISLSGILLGIVIAFLQESKLSKG